VLVVAEKVLYSITVKDLPRARKCWNREETKNAKFFSLAFFASFATSRLTFGCGWKPRYDLCRKQRCSTRQVLIYAGEDGYWVAECPSLPGCISQGKERAEALENIREAIRGYVVALEEDNLPVPEEHFEALLVAV